jgi:hypothetical protein
MFIELNKKIKRDVLQIIKTLKLQSSPQGTLFIFLVTLLILEDLDKEETKELLNVLVFDKNADCFEEENRVHFLLFNFLMIKIRQIDARKIEVLIGNSKEIPHFLKKIISTENILLTDLERFTSNRELLPKEVDTEEKLHKMRTSDLVNTNLKNTKINRPNVIIGKKIKDKK